MTTRSQRTLIHELLAVFAGREEIASIGQLSDRDTRRLAWAIKRGYVRAERRPWPGPLVGTCIKTWYVRVAC